MPWYFNQIKIKNSYSLLKKNGNFDSMKMNGSYVLELQFPNGKSELIYLGDKYSIGSNSQSDYVISDQNIAPTQFVFRISQNILSVQCLGLDQNSTLGNRPLTKDKRYILESGDQLKFEGYVLKVALSDHTASEFTRPEIDLGENTRGGTQQIQNPLTKEMAEQEIAAKKSHKQSRPKIQKATKKTPQVKGIRPKKFDTPIFSLRVLAVLANLALTLGAYQYVDRRLFSPLANFTQNPWILFALEIYCLYWAVDILSSLFLGVNLPLRISGVSAQGYFAEKRLKGLLRGIIGFFTFPFLILDFPALIGRRTFKELLSGAAFQTTSPIFSFFAHGILPLFFLFPIIIPAVLDRGVNPEIQYLSYSRSQGIPKNIFHEFTGVSLALHQALHLSLPDTVVALPAPMDNGVGLEIRHHNQKDWARIKFDKEISFEKELSDFQEITPFSALSIPSTQLLAEQDQIQIHSLLENALQGVQWENLLDVVKVTGPMARPFFQLKNLLVKTFNNPSSLYIYTHGKRLIVVAPQNPSSAIIGLFEGPKVDLYLIEGSTQEFLLNYSLRLFWNYSPTHGLKEKIQIQGPLTLLDFIVDRNNRQFTDLETQEIQNFLSEYRKEIEKRWPSSENGPSTMLAIYDQLSESFKLAFTPKIPEK